MRTILISLAAIVALAPLNAQADILRFEWTNNGTSAALLSGSGFWEIDEADIAAGFGNYATRISSFGFDWLTDQGDFSVSSAAGDAISEGFLNFSDTLELLGFEMCFSADGVCAARTSSPLILMRTRNGGLWGATSGDNDPNFVIAPQSVTVTRVPTPTTLALLGAGLLGLALVARRRRTHLAAAAPARPQVSHAARHACSRRVRLTR